MDRGAWWLLSTGLHRLRHNWPYFAIHGHSPTQLSSPTDKSKRKGRKIWNANLVSSNEKMASLAAQTVKHLPAMRETQVRSLGGEDPLEKEMATHSSILAWKFHEWRSLVGYSPWGRKELDMTWVTSLSFFLMKNKQTKKRGFLCFFFQLEISELQFCFFLRFWENVSDQTLLSKLKPTESL